MTVVVFAMPEQGHFKRLLPLIAGLAAAGAPPVVFTDRRFQADVRRVGGEFIDLFSECPIERADDSSVPIPCRYVSFAGRYADDVVRRAAPLRPSIVVHDTFAVIGVVVAHHLRLPRVNVCAGHNLAPGPTLEGLRQDPRIRVSGSCWDGVRSLRDRHGMPDASPFSYVTALSPDLNVYCEPPEFLLPAERSAFAPIAFFGSLPDEWPTGERKRPSAFGENCMAALRVYASFGTVIWRYYEAQALGALEALSEVMSAQPDAAALVSLGGQAPSERMRRLGRRNMRVVSYVDQWQALGEATVYLTHQGLNSTHEAVFQRTPMISYPFFADQPGLSRRCQELGLAIPLVAGLRGPVEPDDLRKALARLEHERDTMQARLAAAEGWERATIRGRPAVIERILDLSR